MLCKRLCWGVLFFCLDTKEKIPKEKIKAAFSLLLTSSVSLKGLELASLRQSPLSDAPLRAFAWRRKNEAAAVTVEQWGICSFFRLYVVHICFLYDSYIWFPYILFLYDSLVWLIYALLYQIFSLLYLMKGLCPFRFRLFLYDKSLFLLYSCAYVIIYHFHAEWLPGLIYVA